MRHTMAYKMPADPEGNGSGLEGTDIRLDYKPVVMTRYQPMERKY
jgi:succinate dehydrogenase / fumarate reductase flavoprotein subunit